MEQRAQSAPKPAVSKKKKVPDCLVKNLIDGVPFYYPGINTDDNENRPSNT